MSKNKRNNGGKSPETISLGLSTSTNNQKISSETAELDNITEFGKTPDWKKKLLYPVVGIALLFLIGMGVMAKNGWLPSTDAMTGKKTDWFGKALPSNASSSWNPMANPLPNPTPQLSKEYIYAGSRMLAVEDANASAAPPADLAVWRPSTGMWWVMSGQGSQQVGVQWGSDGGGTSPSDIPVQGDYDGDGLTDFSVFRPSTGAWYIIKSSTGNLGTSIGFGYGSNGDKPAPADYDGDGQTDAAVYRLDSPSSGNASWFIRKSTDIGGYYAYQFGLSSDLPAAADYDGDGQADRGVWRNSNQTFYAVGSSTGSLLVGSLGQSGNKVVSADYDGDGKADYAVYDSTSANWHILYSLSGQPQTVQWGNANDVAVPNDYDGDGKVDIAVWRGSTGYWHIRNSSNLSTRSVQWGQNFDIPVPAFYRR